MKIVLLHAALVMSEQGKPDIYKTAVFDITAERKRLIWIEDDSVKSYQLGDCLVIRRIKDSDIFTVTGRCKKRATK